MINDLKKSPDTYPYPHKFNVKYSIKEFIEKYDPICKSGIFLEEEVSIAARVTNIRTQGKKLVFYDLKGDGLKLQVMCNINNHKGAK
jgi:lysyl-tRNA synthetase class 2